MSVRHINAKRGEYVVVHRWHPPRRPRQEKSGWLIVALVILVIIGIFLSLGPLLCIGGVLLVAIVLWLMWVHHITSRMSGKEGRRLRPQDQVDGSDKTAPGKKGRQQK